MGSSRKFFPAVVILLLLVVMATEVAPALARNCEAKSTKFQGICLTDNENCASMCRSEGFSSGDCSPFRRRCICTKPC
ncbi:defensin Ec-AMP-D1-like [Phragmites australis]|uniref:defensin Ec-AMP-D1-like n=1 Tax=Phragmites australis TaxID=29695 RepID=UPI002D766977|nr:defensin Ec-AMP-D1-like [Phragmites australis]